MVSSVKQIQYCRMDRSECSWGVNRRLAIEHGGSRDVLLFFEFLRARLALDLFARADNPVSLTSLLS